MRNEIELLPRICAHVSLAIPTPKFVGEPTNEFPYPYAGYEYIPGQTGDRAALSDDQRLTIAPVLGEFLKQLHSIKLTGIHLPGDTIRRMDIRFRAEKGQERLEYALLHRLLPNPDRFQEIFANAPLSYIPPAISLVHGDLYSRHLIINSANQLAGIIDWGDAHHGDPAADLMILFSLFPQSARKAFLNSYGSAMPSTLAAAQFRAAYHTLQLLAFAHDINDLSLPPRIAVCRDPYL